MTPESGTGFGRHRALAVEKVRRRHSGRHEVAIQNPEKRRNSMWLDSGFALSARPGMTGDAYSTAC
jgi:hypothetical protein